MGYLYEDGSKVAKDALVTEIYQDRSTIAKKAEIAALEQEIQMLQDAQLNGSSFIASTETLTSQLKISTMALSQMGQERGFIRIRRRAAEFSFSLKQETDCY